MNSPKSSIPLFSSVMRLPYHVATLFPLMNRELIEQSARRRTFIVRVVYAAALYGFMLWVFWGELGSWSGQSFAFLGSGRQFFNGLAMLQFCGLYLFLPAMTSGVITIEKERDTLSLLLLTRLGPWSILIGKLLSRLIPMASFVLLSLPLLAVAYSLGGVNEGDILALAWTFSVTALQVGALALACSTWCRTTAASFIATYMLGAILFLGPWFLTQGGDYDSTGVVGFLQEYCEGFGLGGAGIAYHHEDVVLMLFGPSIVLNHPNYNLSFGAIVLRTIPILMFTAACLVFSRAVLWQRAFVKPSNLLLKMFRSLDSLFHRMNQNRFTRGIVLIREQVALPLYEPIRWRETKKRALGTTRYLIRMLLLLEVPVLCIVLFPDPSGNASSTSSPFVAAWILWIVATLVIAIQSAGLIGSERSRQTLDVLLTTPMSSETIVREKFAGIRRMFHMLWIPFATVYLFQALWGIFINQRHPADVIFGLVRGGLAVAIYPSLVAWLGFHYGMRCRSQTQAAMVTLSLIFGICVIPIVLSELSVVLDQPWPFELRWLSPVVALSEDTSRPWHGGYIPLTAWGGLMAHFIMAGSLLVSLWSRGLKTFALRVHRTDGQIVDDEDIERLSQLRQKILGNNVFRSRSDEQ